MPDWVKRASNRDNSANILTGRRVQFESKNNGAHLVIRHPDPLASCLCPSHYNDDHTGDFCPIHGEEPQVLIVDFWPGTGKWIVRGTNVEGRGVFNLLTKLGVRHI